MIDINLNRIRIGTYRSRGYNMKFLGKYEPTNESSIIAGRKTLSMFQYLLKTAILICLLTSPCVRKSYDM